MSARELGSDLGRSACIAWALFMQASFAAQPWLLEGKVIHVEDGDTLTLLQSDFSRTSIRLSDIDAPETSHGRGRPGQPYSQASRQSLSALALGRHAVATCHDRDRWARSVCTVVVDGRNVGAEQLMRGMAWLNQASRRYVRDPQSPSYEAVAKARGNGLWSPQAPKPEPPWVWRKQCWTGRICDGAGQ